ncbi:helix-turn-helix domain-containing protein [Pseudomonas huanghezhanensis]|uniref:helix-turn-helix domain-containing protein n=1 Tax=Pseudomonas huanghezhanensis TaxID=3002903 RepID=UPI00228578E9|nr:helix-turn-helix transcriptional regulator [Pseudomonas sp. BSw22131]
MKNLSSGEFSNQGAGERLREERIRLALSQEDLAQVGNVTRNTQGSYERGGRNPDTAYLGAVAALGVDILYVVIGLRTPALLDGLSAPEDKLIQQYRSLSKDDQQSVQRVVGAMAEVSPDR